MIALKLADAAHTEALGSALAYALQTMDRGLAIALEGNLGAGKTTLARALIRSLGHQGPVVSPSYTLVEPYEFNTRRLLHLDLYRIGDPEELEYLGWREWEPQRDWILVEWPERGAGFLPPFDLSIGLAYRGEERAAKLTATSEQGERLLRLIKDSGDF